jgi:hypothetical protein
MNQEHANPNSVPIIKACDWLKREDDGKEATK